MARSFSIAQSGDASAPSPFVITSKSCTGSWTDTASPFAIKTSRSVRKGFSQDAAVTPAVTDDVIKAEILQPRLNMKEPNAYQSSICRDKDGPGLRHSKNGDNLRDAGIEVDPYSIAAL